MTIASATQKNSYTANGSTTVFAYGFKIFATTDLQVVITSTAGVETTKTLGTHYNVSGAGSASGGNVTFTAGNTPADGELVTISRQLALTQSTDYVENDSFGAEDHEEALDRLVCIGQQLDEGTDRTIKAPISDISIDMTLPVKSLRLDKYLHFNSSTGNPEVAAAVSTISGASDASISSEANGNLITYSSSASKWVNGHALTGDYTVTGSLTTDNVKINGTNIGHTDDTDLLGLADGALTVNGTLTVTGATSLSDVDLTNVGDVALDSISADGTQIDIVLTDNDAAALEIKEGSTAYLTFTTTNSGEKITLGKKLEAGSVEIEGSAFYIDGGDISAATISGSLTWSAAQDLNSQALTNVNIDSGTITGITDLAVADGGTGTSALTDGGVLIGSGTDAITAMGVLADGEMIVGYGSTDPVAESGATLRTSIGVGTGDSPQFTAIELGHASDTTIARSGSGDITVEGNQIYRAGGTDVPVSDGGTGVSTLGDGHVLLGSGSSAITGLDVTAKGSILVGDGSGDPRALAVGSNTHVLTADSSEASGIKWAAAGGGGAWSVVATSEGSGVSSITLTGIDSTCDTWVVMISDLRVATDEDEVAMRFGTSSGIETGSTSYRYLHYGAHSDTTSGSAATGIYTPEGTASYMQIAYRVGSASREGMGAILHIHVPADSTMRPNFSGTHSAVDADQLTRGGICHGQLNTTSSFALDRINVFGLAGNISGRVTLYKVAHA